MGLGPHHWEAATWCQVRAPHSVLVTLGKDMSGRIDMSFLGRHDPAWSDPNFPQPQLQGTHGPWLDAMW